MFIAQFFTLTLLIVFITTMMLLGWPIVVVAGILSVLLIAKFFNLIFNTINRNI